MHYPNINPFYWICMFININTVARFLYVQYHQLVIYHHFWSWSRRVHTIYLFLLASRINIQCWILKQWFLTNVFNKRDQYWDSNGGRNYRSLGIVQVDILTQCPIYFLFLMWGPQAVRLPLGTLSQISFCISKGFYGFITNFSKSISEKCIFFVSL